MTQHCLLTTLMLFSLLGSARAQLPRVETVKGSISATEMGPTLIHEHLITNFQGTQTEVQLLEREKEAISELLPYLLDLKSLGYQTLIECTPSHIGKNPELLLKLSEASGLNIITNTGLYAAVDKKYLPEYAYTASPGELATRWMKDWETGIGSTGIRPGFIKLGVGADRLDSVERKIFRAGMMVSEATGMPMAVHTGGEKAIFTQLQLAREQDFDTDRMIWTHAQNGTDSSRVAMAKQGIWISLDGVNEGGMQSYLDMLHALKDHGLLNRLLISHDDGWSFEGETPALQLKPFGNGNNTPYQSIEKFLVPALRRAGYSEKEIRMLLVDNPREAFSLRSLD